jgi:hypothetical protein
MWNQPSFIALFVSTLCLIFTLTVIDNKSIVHIAIPRYYNKTNGNIEFGFSILNQSFRNGSGSLSTYSEVSKVISEETNSSSIKVVSIVLDFRMNIRESNMNSWLSHLAFAKMIQVEAKTRLGIETQIIWQGGIFWNSKCILNIFKDVVFLKDRSQFDKVRKQQEKWLSKQSELLIVDSRNWLDALDLLNRLMTSKKALYVNKISLPFIQIKDVPNVHEWSHLLDLKPFFVVDHSCCLLNLPESNHIIIDLNTSLLPRLEMLSDAVTTNNGNNITLFDSSMQNLSKSFALWAEQKGYNLHFVNLKKNNVSEFSKYCLLQRKEITFVGSLDSPINLWAGLVKSGNRVVQLSSNNISEVRKFRRISFSKDDPRSNNIRFETLQKFDESHNVLHIVIQLVGEMGNQLCRLAYAYGLKWMLEEDYQASSKIILRHQPSEKWIRARKSVVTCFPKMRHLDFSEAFTQEFKTQLAKQNSMIGNTTLFAKNCRTENCIRSKLETLLDIQNQFINNFYANPINAKISLPFLYVETMAVLGYINDRYHERIKLLFEFDLDNPDCCSVRAKLGENVVHARGFMQEIPETAKKLGFEELSPNKMVQEVMKDYRPGDKVAVISRFSTFGQNYVHRMQEAKLDARLMENISDLQSFCFLMSGGLEFIANSKSTFAQWAAYLGNASRVRLYNLRSPERGNGIIWYNFTNADIRKRFSLEDYNSEEQDKINEAKRLANSY